MPQFRSIGRRVTTGALIALAVTFTAPLGAHALASASAPAFEASDTAVIDIPAKAGATEIWIDVEHPALDTGNTSVVLAGASLPVGSTPFGVTAIAAADGAATSVSVSTAVDSSPDVAITIVDTDNAVLYEDHVRVQLTVDGSTPPPTPDPDSWADPDPRPSGDSTAAAGSGALGATGAEIPLTVLLLAALALVIGGVLVFARPRRS